MTPVDIDKLKAEWRRALERIGGIETPMMRGDNLSLVLCGHFDNPDQPTDDDTGWSEDAVAGCDEVLKAISEHVASAAAALIAKAERVDAMERALTEAASTFDRFAAALREHDPAAMAQEIAVAEFAASEARNTRSPKESE